MNTIDAWNVHYEREKSLLSYPDENLVRLLNNIEPGPALDLGCGSGRHLRLLNDLGFAPLHGIDSSESSIRMCQSLFRETEAQFNAIKADDLARGDFVLPFPDGSFQVVVLWGVLHYNPPAIQNAMLDEVCRTLRPGCRALGTLRALGDSHFAQNPDISQADMHLFSEQQARALLERHFQHVDLGYMERAPVGDLSKRICHWIFTAAL